MNLKFLTGMFAFLAVTSSAALADPQAQPERGTLSFLFENDLFYNTDRDYTNGVELSYTAPVQDTPGVIVRLAHGLPFFSATGKVRTSAGAKYLYAQRHELNHTATDAAALRRVSVWQSRSH